jgi:hypothetical protein
MDSGIEIARLCLVVIPWSLGAVTGIMWIVDIYMHFLYGGI